MSVDVTEAVARVARDKIPSLEGYTSLPVAADYLHGVTRQRLYQMAVEERVFDTTRAIPGGGPRPAAYVVRDVELLAWRMERCAHCRENAARGDLVAWCTHTDLVVPGWQAAAWEARQQPAA